MNINCIYLDMDGVLVDAVGAIMRMYGIKEDPMKPLYTNVTSWDGIPDAISKKLGKTVTNEEMWARVEHNSPDFWANLEWLPWGKTLFNICSEFSPIVLMTTPTEHPDCPKGKLQWIQNNLPKEYHRRYAMTPCKHHMAHPGALLVDDSTTNLKMFREHGGNVYPWLMPWSENGRDHNYLPHERLEDFRKFLSVIKMRKMTTSNDQ